MLARTITRSSGGRGALALALGLSLSACAPKNYVVLLDNPGGGSGKVVVATKKGEQWLDKSGSATTINRASSPPSEPWMLPIKKIQEVFASAFGARPPRFVKYTLYFKSGGTTLEPASRQEYQEMIAEVAKRPGVDATVAGHADRLSSPQWNERLSLLRAWTIRDDLVKAGVPIERIEIDAYGESRPAVPTADNVPEMRNRRVEVTVR